MAGTCDPAIMIDAAVSKHLEVLSCVRLLGLWIVEGINHRCSIETSLRCPVDALGKWQPRGFQYSRRNIRDMSELRTNLSLGVDARRPMNHDTICRSAIMGRDLL